MLSEYQTTRVVRRGCIKWGRCYYSHPGIKEWEGRSVFVKRSDHWDSEIRVSIDARFYNSFTAKITDDPRAALSKATGA